MQKERKNKFSKKKQLNRIIIMPAAVWLSLFGLNHAVILKSSLFQLLLIDTAVFGDVLYP
jgi:hypothetical protein